jgi:SAM-dependent methyltransferase
MSLYLNLGCGNKLQPGDDWLNIDRVKPGGIPQDVNFRRGDILALPVEDCTVDGVLMLHVFEHIPPCDVEEALKEIWRVLKPGGFLHLEMPNIATACATLLIAMEKTDAQLLMLALRSIYGSHEQDGQNHKWGYSPESLMPILEIGGFTHTKVVPCQSPVEDVWAKLRVYLVSNARLTDEEASLIIDGRGFAVVCLRGEGEFKELPRILATGGVEEGLLGYPAYVR